MRLPLWKSTEELPKHGCSILLMYTRSCVTLGTGRGQATQTGLRAIFTIPWAAPSIRNEVQCLPKEIQVEKSIILVIQGHLGSWKQR